MEKKHNLVEDESILASIDETSTDNKSDYGSISTGALEDILDGNYVNPNITARDTILKICDRIRQAQREWKGAVVSAKRMGNFLHKVFKVAVKELNNSFPTLE